MQKPKAAKPVFVAHVLHGQLAVSQRRTDERGKIGFVAVFVRGPNRSVTHRAPGLTAGEIARFHKMLDQIALLADAQRKAGPFDALHLASQLGAGLDLAQILSMQLLAEYTGAALIYASNIADYLAKPAVGRFDFGLSLDLYRQALDFHDRPSIARILAEDVPHIPSSTMARYNREVIFDTLFHMARRIGRRAEALAFLTTSWTANHTLARAHILIDEAAFHQKSSLVLEIAQFMDQTGQLGARQMAQLIVAQQRLGMAEAAKATFTRLSAQPGPEAQTLIAKVAGFLGLAAYD